MRIKNKVTQLPLRTSSSSMYSTRASEAALNWVSVMISGWHMAVPKASPGKM